MSEAITVTEQPPFVPEADHHPFPVPASPPTAQAFFAVVDSAGALARGFQAVSATSLGVGTYQVLFTHNITRSAYIGTIGLPGSIGTSPPGIITVVGRAGATNGVFVQTFNAGGALANLGFHLAVLS
jgi:hypothetical protein